MTHKAWSGLVRIVVTGCVLVPLWVGAVLAASPHKLLAPTYPGAKRIYGSSGDDCEVRGTQCHFFTRDSLDKVKAFYAKQYGEAQVLDHSKAEGRPYAVVPLEHYYFLGEMGEGWGFDGVRMEGLAVPSWPSTDDKAQKLIRSLYQFEGFQRAVNWSRGQGAGFNGLHSIEEMKALFKKYAYLEARYYPNATGNMRLDQALHAEYQELADQRVERAKAQAKAQQEQSTQNMQQSMMSRAASSQQNAAQGGSAQDRQESAEMEALLKRKPKLRSQLNPLSQQMTEQMQAGKYEEAEVTGDKMEKLMRSDAEVSALLDKQEQRTREQSAKEGANVQQFMQSMTDMQGASEKAVVDARWNTWRDYLAELAKQEQYATMIHIEAPSDAERVNRDRAATLKKYKELLAARGGRPDAEGRFTKEEEGSAPASTTQKQAAPAQPAVSSQKPAEQPPAEQKPSAADQAKSGFKKLKKLF